MTSPPPDEPSEPFADPDEARALDQDDADTGPVQLPATSADADDGWYPGPATPRRQEWEPPPVADRPSTGEATWVDRFDAPLMVNPRTVPVRTPPNPRIVLSAIAIAVAIAAIGGVVYWLTRPSEPSSAGPSTAPSSSTTSTTTPSNAEDEARLTRLLPRGYPPGACQRVDVPKNALAQVKCDQNVDPDGPVSGTFTLVSDKSELDAALTTAMHTAQQVNCPGNIQSPGPWRRNATPQIVSGTLFCGLRDGQPTVMWTDDAKLTLNVVQSGPQGPPFPALYAWWSSHS
jgi:hypothetical protein